MFECILAVSNNQVIGKDNKLPWYISDELKLFKEITLNHPIIMGRKTYDSLPGILPNRLHIVVSTQKPVETHPSVVWVSSIDEAKNVSKESMEAFDVDKAFVVGGKTLVEAMSDDISKLHLSYIDMDVEVDDTCVLFDVDKVFPDKVETSRVSHPKFTHVTYVINN